LWVKVRFLRERGLELSKEKTKMTHIAEGFDFLSFNVRKYKCRLFIKPSNGAVKNFLARVRELIKKNTTSKTEDLIRQLSPKVRGWANHFRHVVAKHTFRKIDYFIFEAL
jgi:RNA-directed DNA polymerase